MGKPIDCITCGVRKNSLFRELSAENLQVLNQMKVTIPYRKRQVIFCEGNTPFGLYCVNSGMVKVYKLTKDNQQQIMRLAQAGDWLGYRALFADEPYRATAEAMTNCLLCFFEKKDFFRYFQEVPQLFFTVVKKLGRELGIAEDHICAILSQPVRQRLAELLLSLKEVFGAPEGKAYRLTLPLSRKEMAALIGTTQQTVVRFLMEFRRKGYITFNGKQYTILDISALESETSPSFGFRLSGTRTA